MKFARDLIPWTLTDISAHPYGPDWWSFNPSIHREPDGTWLCVLRVADYAMPGGVTVRGKKAGSTGQQTKNAMLVLDPTTWRPIRTYKMHERDGLPRESTPHLGFEDMRLFRTDSGGLQGIAASLHLQRDQRIEGVQHQPPEQVVLTFDSDYNIVVARPIRGGGWSGPQKNWVPFDDAAEPRFMYSLDKGRMFDNRGPVHDDAAIARPSLRVLPPSTMPPTVEEPPVVPPPPSEPPPPSPPPPPQDHRPKARGGEVRSIRGRGRIMLDQMMSRPLSRPHPTARPGGRTHTEAARVTGGGGRTLMPTYDGLRGGTQLVRIGDDKWLGLGHSMKWSSNKKFYWHVAYVTDGRGKMIAASEPFKLASETIEFAAGMALDGDRLVISFGVDDAACRLGETRLSAVMELLRPI